MQETKRFTQLIFSPPPDKLFSVNFRANKAVGTVPAVECSLPVTVDSVLKAANALPFKSVRSDWIGGEVLSLEVENTLVFPFCIVPSSVDIDVVVG